MPLSDLMLTRFCPLFCFALPQAHNNCFELFGFDLMVDEDWKVWLLEANAEPDFKQTGNRLQQLVHDVVEETLVLTLDRKFEFGAHTACEGAVDLKFATAYERAPRPW